MSIITDEKQVREHIEHAPDSKAHKWLERGDKPIAMTRHGNTHITTWDIAEHIEREGRAPLIPRVSEGLQPMAGTPWRTKNNIPFIVITGNVQGGGQLEISRDLLAPARLASKELGTMPGNPLREAMWYNNMIANRDAIAAGKPIQRNRFKNQPVIIAGAGPSLLKHVDLLNDCEFPVLLTNQAIRVIDPKGKIFVSIDYLGNRKWLPGLDLSETEAVFDTLTSPVAVNHDWKSTSWFRQTYDRGLACRTSRDWYPRMPILDPGHCVAYSALGLALWWGADPIIFVGQDFSYGSDRTMHAGEGAESVRQSENIPLIEMKDFNGNKTTSDRMMRGAALHVMGSVLLTSVYGWMWGTPPHTVNCSEQGILDIPLKMPLAEALDRCRNDPDSMRAEKVELHPALRGAANRLKSVLVGGGYTKQHSGRKKAQRRYTLHDAVFKKDSYYSVEYHGPDNPELRELPLDVVKVEDDHGRDVLMNRVEWEKMQAAKAEEQDGDS